MKPHKDNSGSSAPQDLYPGGFNTAGVPLKGQTGQQAVKNFEQIISQMTPADRLMFDLARACASEEAKQTGPCSCDSGRKYKNCHLKADRRSKA